MTDRLNPRVASLTLVLVFGVVFGGAVSGWAQNKVDLYKTADAAAAAGKIAESQKAYCQVAKMDARYKDAKMLCTIMTEELGRENKKNDERYTTGLKEFKDGRFDSAQHAFANIRWGAHFDEAQQYLKVKIPQARQGGSR